MLVLIFLTTFVFSWLLTGAMRRYALARSLVDIPGARSSHQVPTPRGGGVAIVTTVLLGMAYLVLAGTLDGEVAVALGGAGMIVAAIGFWDDHGHVAARWRLLGHFVAAAWGLFWLGGMPPITIWDGPVDLGWAGDAFALFFLVWLLNLYNFMDGINGIASIEAITVVFCGAVVLWVASVFKTHFLFIVIMGSTFGFLLWNFPRARIFMGDACSGFLGLLLGLIAIWQAHLHPEFFLAWTIHLGVFIVDATVTLIRRIARGDRFYEAHRSHAYQFASRQLGSHTPVSLTVGAINLLWLLPLGLSVAHGSLPGMLGLAVAYVPLIGLAFYYQAGAPEFQETN